MKIESFNYWKENRFVCLFETGQAENQEARKPTAEKENLVSDAKLKEASQTPEAADKMRKELVSLAEQKGEDNVERGQDKIDPNLSVLRGHESLDSSERLNAVAKNHPELVLGMANSLKDNADYSKLMDTAFQNAFKKNPGAALAFMYLCPAEKRDGYVKQAIKSAFENHDQRTAAGYAYLLGDKDRKSVMSLVKKSDPDGYRRYSA